MKIKEQFKNPVPYSILNENQCFVTPEVVTQNIILQEPLVEVSEKEINDPLLFTYFVLGVLVILVAIIISPPLREDNSEDNSGDYQGFME